MVGGSFIRTTRKSHFDSANLSNLWVKSNTLSLDPHPTLKSIKGENFRNHKSRLQIPQMQQSSPLLTRQTTLAPSRNNSSCAPPPLLLSGPPLLLSGPPLLLSGPPLLLSGPPLLLSGTPSATFWNPLCYFLEPPLLLSGSPSATFWIPLCYFLEPPLLLSGSTSVILPHTVINQSMLDKFTIFYTVVFIVHGSQFFVISHEIILFFYFL